MFEFRHVELMNWAYWPTIKLPLDQRTMMITGPNGSGKTTFLDALRTLLRAPRLSANRRFTDYLVGRVDTAVIKAVVTNDYHQRERRPFEFRGCTSDLVTLAILMKQRAGRWEKRFAILDGDVPLDGLRDLSRGAHLTPESYTHEIQEAGFSSAFLKVLALEQGQTDKLCEKSPRELLELLLDVHGDKAVIDRYQKAREHYQVANLEMTQLSARLAEEQARVLSAQRLADACRRYAQLTSDLQKYEQVILPQAEYKEALGKIEEANLGIADLNLRLRPVDREVIELETVLENAGTELERRKTKALSAGDIKQELERKERQADILLNQLVSERKQLQDLLASVANTPAEPVEQLRTGLELARRERLRHELRVEELQERLEAVQNQLRGLEQRTRRKLYPPYVEEFLGQLRRANIAADLLCDLVEITDKSWQLAVESILGRDRFTVLVDPTDQQAARQLGERLRYRHYVVARETGALQRFRANDPRAVLRVVEIGDDGVPSWLVETLGRTLLVETVGEGIKLGPQAVSVTRQAYRQDRRGGISIAVDQFYCGNLGQTTQVEELHRELDQTAGQMTAARQAQDAQRRREQDFQTRIALQETRTRAEDARRRVAELDDEVSRVNGEHKQALTLRREAERQLVECLNELNNFERDLEHKRRELQQRRNQQSEYLDSLKEYQESIRRQRDLMAGLADKLDPELISERALREVPDIDELTPRYYAIQNQLREYDTPPDPSAVEIYEHHKSQYERQRQLYQDHEAGLRHWEAEFRLARQKFLMVVEHTIREYRKNILSLAELAGVSAEVIPPDLRDDADALESAGLVVRFGFDGKRPVDISGSSHSGGQRVVASLVLLMSLATSGGVNRGGFFIIDEPFAHLSLERIDDVSRFLERTACQFILTSPTTHNVNVFNAARLLINFRIKKPGAEFAPLPTIIRR